MSAPFKRRWTRPQISLWGLLALITLCTPFLAYLSMLRRRNEQKAAVYEESVAKGGHFAVSPLVPPPSPPSPESAARELWKSIVKQPDLPEFTRLAINDIPAAQKKRPPIVDDDLKKLVHLPEIQDFDLYYARQATDEGLAVLAKLPQLRRLRLADLPQITGKFLEHFSEENEIESITFSQMDGLRGEHLRALSRFRKLKHFRMSSSKHQTDEAYREVSLPPNVTELEIHRVDLSDATLSRWLVQVKLQKLKLQAPITRALAPALARQSALHQLAITNAPFLDSDFAFLQEFHELRSLTLNGMPIRGELLDYLPNPERITALALNNTLLDDAQLSKLSKFEKLAILGMAWTPLTGEGFRAEVAWPTPWSVELCGTRFSDAGKEAFVRWKGLKQVCFPSNWETSDFLRYAEKERPSSPSLSIARKAEAPGVNVQYYTPAMKIDYIDHCPADLMKPVADLQALGQAEHEAENARQASLAP